MTDMQKIAADVRALMTTDKSGHGFDHVERVCRLAQKLAMAEKADEQTVTLAALLHDCDDYKLVGEEAAAKMTNARRIMAANGVAEERQQEVLEIIASMGYSKCMRGIRPRTLAGKIVSDADMLDAMGACGIVRCLQFALDRCNKFGAPVFDAATLPDPDMSVEEYKKPNRKNDNFINHFFEKLLKLHHLLLTPAAHEEGEKRHRLMVAFLRGFFAEQELADWLAYLENFLREEDARAAGNAADGRQSA